MEASESSTEPAAAWGGPDPSPSETDEDTFAERPEVFVGAAFAGGLGVALVLRWLGSR